jgi:hypothetical protein
MAECKPASEGSNIVSSCERILDEFQANGRPAGNLEYGSGGSEVLGGFAIMTPRVGTGFIEWAVKDYNLDGKTNDIPADVNYNKKGDWLYDKETIAIVDGPGDDKNYRKK